MGWRGVKGFQGRSGVKAAAKISYAGITTFTNGREDAADGFKDSVCETNSVHVKDRLRSSGVLPCSEPLWTL